LLQNAGLFQIENVRVFQYESTAYLEWARRVNGTIVEDFDGDAYRAVYTVRFAEAVYVLHAFPKKSTKGRATPQREIDEVESRLKRAQEEYAAWQKTKRRPPRPRAPFMRSACRMPTISCSAPN
jgi:Phage derived protein Gp49-like (DUF891)